MARRKKQRKRSKTVTMRVGEIAAGAKLFDGLFGVNNLTAFDFSGMLNQAVDSVMDPFADGGLLDDAIDAAMVYIIIDGTGKIIGKLTGKRPGGGIPGVFRITL